MPRSFICYIHKPGVMTPELRVISCDSDEPGVLVDSIWEHVTEWPDFEMVEVYDENDTPLMRLERQPVGVSPEAHRL
jgi:hypothetical protein